MQEEEQPGLLSRAWNWVKRVACSIVCAWKEILIWVLVMVLIAIMMYFMVTLTISFFAEVIFTAPAGPVAWIVNIVLAIVWVIVIVLLLLAISYIHDYVWQRLTQKFWACWQAC